VDIKAPTVSEVRRSRREGAPIPRQVMQETIERLVSGCRTLEILQTALQAEGMTLILTPVLPDALPIRRSKRKGRGKEGREETTSGYKTSAQSFSELDTGESASAFRDATQSTHAELTGSLPGRISAPQIDPSNYIPTPTPPTPLIRLEVSSQTRTTNQAEPNLSRYQLVYQWTPPNGKVQTFSASALGKRYTQRGLQERWGVGLKERDWVEWSVQQSVKTLFADQLGTGFSAAVAQMPVTADEETVGVGLVEPQTQVQALENSPTTTTETATPPPIETTQRTPEKVAARQFYQDAWLKESQAYTQATGLTQETDPLFEVQVLSQARKRWELDQCVAMLMTTPKGTERARQGREVFTAYVQQLFDQVEVMQRSQSSVKATLER